MIEIVCRRCKSVEFERVRKQGADKFFHFFRRLQVFQCDDCGARFRWYGKVSFASVFIFLFTGATLSFAAVNYDSIRSGFASVFGSEESVVTPERHVSSAIADNVSDNSVAKDTLDSGSTEGLQQERNTNIDIENPDIKSDVDTGNKEEVFGEVEIASQDSQEMPANNDLDSIDESVEKDESGTPDNRDDSNIDGFSVAVADQSQTGVLEQDAGSGNEPDKAEPASVDNISVDKTSLDKASLDKIREPFSEDTEIDPNLYLQPGTSYTIQIGSWRNHQLGLQSINTLSKLLPEDFYYYRIGGEQAFTRILYGSFPTSVVATSAIETLPEEIRQGIPYVRKMSTVRKAFE